MDEVKHHVGILYTDNMNSGLTHDFFSPLINTFKYSMEKEGFSVSFVNAEKKHPYALSYLEQMKKFFMGGMLVININNLTDELKEVLASGYPVVTIDYKTPGAISISSDNYTGIVELVKYVYELGHCRVAFMVGDANSEVAKKRLQSFKDTCAELGIPLNPQYIRESKFRDMRMASRITEELLSLPEPPTCILYPDDFAAVGGINVLRARGLEIPKDISYCGYDGIKLIGYFDPSITTIQQDSVKMGEVAAHKLMEMIETGTSGDGSEIIIPVKLLEGKTVRRVY